MAVQVTEIEKKNVFLILLHMNCPYIRSNFDLTSFSLPQKRFQNRFWTDFPIWLCGKTL